MLATDIWAGALIRRAQLAGAFAVVVRKGDARAGAVLVKARNPRTGETRLYASAPAMEAERIWIEPHPGASEADLDAYAERTRKFDSDLWVIEIEDGEGRHFLTERVENR